MFLHHLVRWPSADIQVKFYGDRPRGTPSLGELNTRGVAEYSDFAPIERYEDRAAGLCLRVALPRQSVLGLGSVKTCMRAVNG